MSPQTACCRELLVTLMWIMVGCTRSLLSPPLLSAISICWTFLHCTLSNVSNVSNWLLEIIHSHIDMHYLKHCAPSFSLLFCLRSVFGKMDQMLSAWVIFSSYSPLEVLLLFSRFIVELWIFFTKCKDDSFPFLNDNFLWCTSGLFSCFEKKFEYLHICKELCWYETMTCHMQSEPTSLRKKHVWMSSYLGKDLFCLKDNAACKLDPSFSSKKCNCILCQLCILCMHVLYIVAKSFLFARQRWTFIQKATPPPPPFPGYVAGVESGEFIAKSWKHGKTLNIQIDLSFPRGRLQQRKLTCALFSQIHVNSCFERLTLCHAVI